MQQGEAGGAEAVLGWPPLPFCFFSCCLSCCLSLFSSDSILHVVGRYVLYSTDGCTHNPPVLHWWLPLLFVAQPSVILWRLMQLHHLKRHKDMSSQTLVSSVNLGNTFPLIYLSFSHTIWLKSFCHYAYYHNAEHPQKWHSVTDLRIITHLVSIWYDYISRIGWIQFNFKSKTPFLFQGGKNSAKKWICVFQPCSSFMNMYFWNTCLPLPQILWNDFKLSHLSSYILVMGCLLWCHCSEMLLW